MFDFVRSHNRLFQIALGVLIIPSFVLFGVQSYTSMNSEQSAEVAEVDGKKITRTEWDNEHRQDVSRMQQQRPGVDPKLFDTPEAQRASLDALVRDRVLQASVVHDNLGVSDERVTNYIRTDPQFEQLRSLDKAQIAAVLAQQGLTPDGLFQRVGEGLTRQQPLQGVTGSVLVPAVASKADLDAWFDQRQIQWQRFDAKDAAAAIAPTDAQVQAYYADKTHAAEFLAPEQAQVEYVVLDVNALKAQVSVDPKVLQAFYETNKARYTASEERRASHILVNVDPKASPADVAKAKAQADALLAEVRKNPASFAEVAKRSSQDAGSAAGGGDLDFMKKDAIPGAFSDALFSMKQGEISNVVRSTSGFHIIEMTGVRGGTVKPFDEVKAEIEDTYRTQEAQKLYTADAEKFTNTVYEQADSLDPAVKAFKLTKQTAAIQRTPLPGATGPLASPRLLDAVFANDAVKGKHNTEAIETGPSQLTSARVLSYTAQHQRPLAEVHDQVVESVRKAMAAAAARKDGEARVAAATKDASLALPLAATVGRTVQTPDIPRPVIEAALRANLTKGPTVTGLALPDGSYAAIRVLKSVPHTGNDAEVTQAKTLFEQAYAEAEGLATYDSLKARYKAKYFDDKIAKGSDTTASAPK